MPAKYSHIKKRPSSGLVKKDKKTTKQQPNPHLERTLSAVSQLERAIARVLLIRYEQDIARLFSTRLYSIALTHLPALVFRIVTLGGPGWLAFNHDSDDVKDLFRTLISMDMRQAGDRVATKSILWSYTALRHFAISNDVPICQKLGFHSLHLLPFLPALQSHLSTLEVMSPPSFSLPPHLSSSSSLQQAHTALKEACFFKFKFAFFQNLPEWEGDWKSKIQYGYEKLTETLWEVAREFDVQGYGTVLRDKLVNKWCDCGCSTDHLGEVCEGTVREEEEMNGAVKSGKRKEWDGRGSGVFGWETEEEEDIWEVDLDIGCEDPLEGERQMTIGEMMEWRYLRAENEKEQGNAAFRKGDYQTAVIKYEAAYDIEPEMPHYQLNLAAAHLKLNNWIEAEKACSKALTQHRSSKGLYRRAKAKKMLGRTEEAIRDLKAVLRIQPNNQEAFLELLSLIPPIPLPPEKNTRQAQVLDSASSSSSSSKQPPTRSNSEDPHLQTLRRLGVLSSKSKRIKIPPPFEKTRADERKLRIVPGGGAGSSNGKASSTSTSTTKTNRSEAKGNENKGKNGRDNGRKSERTKRLKEMDSLRKECVSYPSWDRYVVKRVD